MLSPASATSYQFDPLNRAEAMRISELQAQRFLKLTGVSEPSVPERVIAELPRLQVERISPLPVSGATNWASQRWLVILNGSEPLVRQRFSLAHEFKHILDHRVVDVLYAGAPAAQRAEMIEQVCDYFAGCLLIPRPWLKSAWGNGIQSVDALAQRFGVSQAAIQVRLSQIGLAMSPPRCGNHVNGWDWSQLQPKIDRFTYSRSPVSVFT